LVGEKKRGSEKRGKKNPHRGPGKRDKGKKGE